MTSEMKNLKKSIHQRLLNISRNKKEDFQLILIRFALERFLYRLSKSKYADQFILSRKTDIPSQPPLALSDEFSLDPVKQTQWKAFLNKNGLLELPENLTDIIAKLRKFLVPALNAAAGNYIFPLSWPSGGPWQHKHH